MEIITGPPDILRFLEDPCRVLVGIQELIAGAADMPRINSAVIALWVMAGYSLAEGATRHVEEMIEAVPAEARSGLLELLALISKRPVPGGALTAHPGPERLN